MIKTLLTTSLLAFMTVSPVMAQQKTALKTVDPGFNILTYLFYPIVGLAKLQSQLSPEKPSCWNEGAKEVSLCELVE